MKGKVNIMLTFEDLITRMDELELEELESIDTLLTLVRVPDEQLMLSIKNNLLLRVRELGGDPNRVSKKITEAKQLTKAQTMLQDMRVKEEIKEQICECKKQDYTAQGKVAIDFDVKTMKPKQSIENFEKVLFEDKYFDNLKYNEQASAREVTEEDGTVRHWEDSDLARIRSYFEREYDLYSPQKLDDALANFFKVRSYNPLKELIESIKWDGKDRIKDFLQEFLRPSDDPEYISEVSRLIFAGAIHRLYEPGCKFDCVPILVGEQGIAKSTFIRWLNPSEEYFREIKTLEGTKAEEIMQGGFICEMAELVAVRRASDIEKVKAFITTQVDTWRQAYARNVSYLPRKCIFIGSTNEMEFLVDRTGNRRYLPIHPTIKKYELPRREDEFKNYVLQCWAEAREKYFTPYMKTYYDETMAKKIEEVQLASVQEDTQATLIEAYIADKAQTCVLDVFINVFHGDPTDLKGNRSLSYDISKSMQGVQNLVRTGKTYNYKYKVWDNTLGTHKWISTKQKEWRNLACSLSELDELVLENGGTLQYGENEV